MNSQLAGHAPTGRVHPAITKRAFEVEIPVVMRSFASVSGDVYGAMQGPEWNITGNLRDWDVTARMSELELPVLVTSGRYDEMTPALVEPLVTGIRGAEHVVFGESAHLAMAEEPDRYREIVASFCSRAEGESPEECR